MRSVYHEAVLVLAGGIPLDLLLHEDVQKFKFKKEGLGDLSVNISTKIAENLRKWKEIIQEEIIDDWNLRRGTTLKGASLRKYLPTVRSRLEAKWVLPDYWISQFLTGHGGFRVKLYEYGKEYKPSMP